jgi:hypothetical protein
MTDCARSSSASHTPPASSAAERSFLPPEYNFIVFFSLPFLPVSRAYKKNYWVYGHLSLALGDTVYQVHDPARLRARFLVSRMPVTDWLFSDGAWYERDASSPGYRHVHLYETAEVRRTAVCYAAARNVAAGTLRRYQRYLEGIERSFHRGAFTFHLLFNNCTHVLNRIFYREQWLNRGPFDFIPAVAFKRLIRAWTRIGMPYTTGILNEHDPARFTIHPVCLGLKPFAPLTALARSLSQARGTGDTVFNLP